jgi:hypothetical protein
MPVSVDRLPRRVRGGGELRAEDETTLLELPGLYLPEIDKRRMETRRRLGLTEEDDSD